MKYWVTYGAFQMFELFADFTLAFILPFYIELKILTIIWLVLGTKLVFDTIVNRELARREKSIDRWLHKLSKARDELLALVWYEVSQCSLKILTTLMSGGLSVLTLGPPTPTPPQSQKSSPCPSPCQSPSSSPCPSPKLTRLRSSQNKQLEMEID